MNKKTISVGNYSKFDTSIWMDIEVDLDVLEKQYFESKVKNCTKKRTVKTPRGQEFALTGDPYLKQLKVVVSVADVEDDFKQIYVSQQVYASGVQLDFAEEPPDMIFTYNKTFDRLIKHCSSNSREPWWKPE